MWILDRDPEIDGKYWIAVRKGTKIDYDIGHWSNDLSKIDQTSFEPNKAGWYYFNNCSIAIRRNVVGWAPIVPCEPEHDGLDSSEYSFFD